MSALCCVCWWCWLLLFSKQNVTSEEIVPRFRQRPLLRAVSATARLLRFQAGGLPKAGQTRFVSWVIKQQSILSGCQDFTNPHAKDNIVAMLHGNEKREGGNKYCYVLVPRNKLPAELLCFSLQCTLCYLLDPFRQILERFCGAKEG